MQDPADAGCADEAATPAATRAVDAREAIAAVVVSHQSAATIDACLQRLRAAAGVAQIRVVDNLSTDDTLAIVQRHALADRRVRFIANPDNPGFAVACNQGAADSDASWLAFVNPDCLVEADSLARLRAHALAIARAEAPAGAPADAPADAHEPMHADAPARTRTHAGACEALLGADLVDEAGVRDGAARRSDPQFAAMLRSSAARRLDIAVDDGAAVQPVPAISGALMLMPRTLFERIGGFDEGYRLHAEDLDFCRRARDAGAAVAVANDVRVVHVRGVSSRSRPLFVEWHKHRGLARYFRKFEAPRRGLFVRMCVYAMIWARFSWTAPTAALRTLRRR